MTGKKLSTQLAQKLLAEQLTHMVLFVSQITQALPSLLTVVLEAGSQAEQTPASTAQSIQLVMLQRVQVKSVVLRENP